VWEVRAALPDLPVVGVGGLSTGFDVLAMLAAGATAVQLGSVLLRDPSAATRIRQELLDEMDRRDLGSVASATGLAHHRHEGSSR
jgi:dihydroorotate dehydrogenase (NAD+) catalytic subunit